MEIQLWPLERLEPYPNNPRLNDPAVEPLAAAINEFGFRVPIIALSSGEIVDGHLRLKAAQHLGLSEVPVVLADDLTEDQVRAFRIAVNRMAELADWDLEKLSVELKSIDVELQPLLGWDKADLSELTHETVEGLSDPDQLPAPVDNPVSREGDIWLMGDHRLACGDSTSAESVARLLDGAEPHLMVTDPPYGVNYDPEWRPKFKGGKTSTGRVTNDHTAFWLEAYKLFPGDVVYLWMSEFARSAADLELKSLGFEIRNIIIWAKSSFPFSRGHYHWQHESCIYAVRNKAHWNGDRKQSTLWEIKSNSGTNQQREEITGHSTQKPIECMARPVRNNSKPGDLVYDPFMGSGSTLIACEREARAAYGMEIHPPYVDMAVKRWQDFTGNQAIRESDGARFSELQ